MRLDKDRASYLLDKVIIPSLKLDVHDLFDGFLRVLEQYDETKELCENLKLHLRQSSQSESPHAQMIHYPIQQLPYGLPYTLYGQSPHVAATSTVYPHSQPLQGQLQYGALHQQLL